MPTATLEEYIEAIYKLSMSGPTRPTLIADAMDVSAPTVTATLRRLAASGLVDRPKGRVVLTEEGRLEALSLLRRHRLAERFLVDALGLPWDEVHEDACLLEHALSPRVQDALETFLDNPELCPHGHPIPSADLAVAPTPGILLSSAPIGERLRIVSIEESDDAVLSLVKERGLLPGSFIVVTRNDGEDGLTVEGDKGEERLAVDATRRIRVLVEGGTDTVE